VSSGQRCASGRFLPAEIRALKAPSIASLVLLRVAPQPQEPPPSVLQRAWTWLVAATVLVRQRSAFGPPSSKGIAGDFAER